MRAGQAALWYPIVGALLGTLLALTAWLLATAPAGLSALLVLLLWIWGTGALHLDGLADCADAWVGGLGDRQRTWQILKDPHTGTMGSVALLALLLTKWVSIETLLSGDSVALVWLISLPALARAQVLLLVLTTPAAQTQGLGATLRQTIPRPAAWMIYGLSWLLAGWFWGIVALEVWLLLLALWWLWRRTLLARLGGLNGDGAGALIELSEAAGLVMIAL